MSAPEIIDNDTAEAVDTSNQLETWNYFPTTVYAIKKPEFVEQVLAAGIRAIPEHAPKEINDLYPVLMSDNIYNDETVQDFVQYVGQTAWNILDFQGYAMDQLNTYFTEMWMQEHHKHSLMEQHSHAAGVQLVGFYFLDAPENCSKLFIHDPRPAKVQINLPQKNMTDVTNATDMVNFTPEPGLLLFTNAWLPHSFGRHGSTDPIRFIHFNVSVTFNPNATCPLASEAEII